MSDLVGQYLADGFVGPLPVLSEARAAELLETFGSLSTQPGCAPARAPEQVSGRLLGLADAGDIAPFVECRHLDCTEVFDLCRHPLLIGPLQELCGPDLVLWRSTFINKAAGGPEYRWHQDFGGVFGRDEPYGLEPPFHINVWLALTHTTQANGCLRFLPGESRVLPAVPASAGRRATLLVPETLVDERKVLDVPLRPGEAVIFSDRVVHSSYVNTTDEPRIGFALRVTVPSVRVRPLFPGHRCMMLAGDDRAGFNCISQAPQAEPTLELFES